MNKIAVVCGGYSGEAKVSMKSADMIMSNIDATRFDAYQIVISPEKWVMLKDGSEYPVNRDDFSVNFQGEKIKFDAVFNIIHGTPGEDGKLMGYFDMLGIKYNNSGVLTSAITFNKDVCNNLLKHKGVKAAQSFLFKRGQTIDAESIEKTVDYPLFIKPNKGGSSIGTSKVYNRDEFHNAMNIAFAEDDEVLVEEFIQGREITCGLFKYNGEILTFPITEIVTKHDFFDFVAKYTDGETNEITPAPIPDAIRDKCWEISKNIYKMLDCKGFSRIDYIIKNDELYFLEVNTVPGFSKNSIVPQQARVAGIETPRLITMVVEEMLRG